MDKGRYEVELIDRSTGEVARYVSVVAQNRDEALNKVARMGEIVGNAQLVEVVEEIQSASTEPVVVQWQKNPEVPRSATGALVLAVLGLIFWPLAPIGWVMAERVNAERRRLGAPPLTDATAAGWIGGLITILGVLVLLAICAGGFNP